MSRASTKAYRRSPPKDKEGWITKHRSEKEFAKVSHLSKTELLEKNRDRKYTSSSQGTAVKEEVSLDRPMIRNPYKTVSNVETKKESTSSSPQKGDNLSNDTQRHKVTPSKSSSSVVVSNPYKTKKKNHQPL